MDYLVLPNYGGNMTGVPLSVPVFWFKFFIYVFCHTFQSCFLFCISAFSFCYFFLYFLIWDLNWSNFPEIEGSHVTWPKPKPCLTGPNARSFGIEHTILIVSNMHVSRVFDIKILSWAEQTLPKQFGLYYRYTQIVNIACIGHYKTVTHEMM